MKEKHIEETCVKMAKKEGYYVRKMAFIADSGCPDRMFFKENHLFWVEFKSDTGKLSAKQIYTIEKLKLAGQLVYVINDIEEFKKIIKLG